MKYLILIDCQNDFCTGTLKNEHFEKTITAIVKKAKELKEKGYYVIATRDTHHNDYLNTQEGKNLPVVHCIQNTSGWEVVDELKPLVDEYVDKPTFGFLGWKDVIKDPETIEICGTVTSICVSSNAIILKATFPETSITVYKDLCSGLSDEDHNAAITVMKMQQFNIM